MCYFLKVQTAKHLRYLGISWENENQLPNVVKILVFYRKNYWHGDHPRWSNMNMNYVCTGIPYKMIEFACFLGTLTHLVWTHIWHSIIGVCYVYITSAGKKKTVNLVFFRLTFKTCGCQDKSQDVKSNWGKCVPALESWYL